MPGLINTTKSGQYRGASPIKVGNTTLNAAHIEMQDTIFHRHNALFEGSQIDTKASIHSYTAVIPKGFGVFSHEAAGEAMTSMDASDIFFINSYAVNHSGTKRRLNAGNCPVAIMTEPTRAKTICFIAG